MMSAPRDAMICRRAQIFRKKDQAMTDTITTLSLSLQTHVKELQDRMAALNTKADASLEHAGKELRHQMDVLEAKAEKAKVAVEASTTVVQKWADDSLATVDGWKAKFDANMLKARADRADHYAKAAFEVAIASVGAAEKAALAAKLAHVDAKAAATPKAA
jgi:chemotaxis regulatin CheY-phosphate phosphatase CheZ